MDPMGNESLAKHGISGREFRSWRCFIVILQITSYLHETIHISPLERKTKPEANHFCMVTNYTNLTGKKKQKLLVFFAIHPFFGEMIYIADQYVSTTKLDFTAQLQLVMPHGVSEPWRKGAMNMKMLEKRKDCYVWFPCLCLCVNTTWIKHSYITYLCELNIVSALVLLVPDWKT